MSILDAGDTWSNVIMAWCATLTLLGGVTVWIFRHWLKRYTKRYNEALSTAERRIDKLEKALKARKRDIQTLRHYANVLINYIRGNGNTPPDPPKAFYD